MNISLWISQSILAIFFIMVGALKLFSPIDGLVEQMPWVIDVPSALVRFIGLAEIAGGIGLVLPAVAKILPWLTPLAGAALALNMVFSIAFHVSRGEFSNLILKSRPNHVIRELRNRTPLPLFSPNKFKILVNTTIEISLGRLGLLIKSIQKLN